MYAAIAVLVVAAAGISAGAIAILRAQRQAREYLHRQAAWHDRAKDFQAKRRAHHIARERLRQLHTRGGNGAA